MCTLLSFFATSAIGFAEENWKKELKNKLTEAYPLTKIGSHGQASEPGIVVVVKVDGITIDPEGDAVNSVTYFENGRLSRPKGFLNGVMSSKRNSSQAAPGDRFYIYGIIVGDKDIGFKLMSVRPIQSTRMGTSRNIFFKATPVFRYEEGALETADLAKLKKDFEQVFMPEGQAQGTPGQTEASTKPAASIELGQTMDQVKAAFGQPEKIVNLGAKMIFTYKDLKVTFQDGKVIDVQ